MPTAILIDGAFFVKRFRALEPGNAHDAERAADCAFRWALAHLVERGRGRGKRFRELFRIYFYDCPPLMKRLQNPISGKGINFSTSSEALFRIQLHERLKTKRKMALRLGHLASDSVWTIKPEAIQALLKRKIRSDDLTEGDVVPHLRQKGVDMNIGVDIVTLALRKQVDQIVLVSGDSDFVPAAKLARREGVDFILDPMWQPVSANLQEHIDGLRSTARRRERRDGEDARRPESVLEEAA
ncbi:NYN domain-containing protein [Mitsuaria sp. GD03876]|uniref:NYN domain-containing protein n=1 Tax=Mitsuaria sp. GD03876 TaxID=2975399 RepID=UPI002448AC43|nr:NYN domain-containing protein [Mitsuaria sp. GD03876]MDH0864441.1 NYN domain-containing protein [Mitsuaria sp. GD03876]